MKPQRGGARRTAAREIVERAERWGLWLLVISMAAAIPLTTLRVWRSEFSLLGRSDLVALRVSDNTTLLPLQVSDVSVSGLRTVDTLDGTAPPASFDDAVDLKVEGSGSGSTNVRPISIPALTVSPDTIVTLEKMDTPGRYLLVLAPTDAGTRSAGSRSPVKVRIIVPPGFSLRYSDRADVETIDGAVPRPLELAGDASGLEIAFTLTTPEASLLSAAPVHDLRLWSIEARGTTPGVRTSGIRDGRVTFLTTPDAPVALDRLDDIDLALRSGVLHALTLTTQTMELNLSGEVNDVRKRIGSSMPSQMPTWFDYLSRIAWIRFVAAIVTGLSGFELVHLLRRTR